MKDKGTILVVDDTPASLELLVDTLTAQGYQVLSADSGELALASVAARPPELILLDIRMPGLDGFEVCRRLQAHPESRDIPVVFISASGESAERLDGLKVGAVDYVTKPFEREELLARVQTHLELRRLRVRLEQQATDLRQANEQLQAELAERKRAEEALGESQLRYRSLFENMLEGFAYCQMLYDQQERPMDFVYLEVNGAFERLTGLGNVVGKPVSEVIPGIKETSPELFESYSRVAATGKPEHFEFDFKSLSQWLSISVYSPKKGFFVAVFENITERKRTELEIQRQADFARFNPNPVLELSAAGEITYFNDATGEMARALGLENPAQMLPPNTAGIVRECLAAGKPKLRVETQIGSRVFSWSFFPVKLNHTVHCYAGDITERKQMEEKLRQLSRAVEQSPASIVITDPAGDIEYVNPKFVEVTGYSLAEVMGKNPRVLKSGEKSPEAYHELWQTITAGKEWRGEFHNKKRNGERYWESASISPIRDLAGRITHYVAVKEDISARKQIEAERDKLIQDLQKALANVKSLSGLLPICAGCKKIRDDKGYWSQVESYVQKHSEATFTHGLCPDCIKKYYAELGVAGPGDSHKETS